MSDGALEPARGLLAEALGLPASAVPDEAAVGTLPAWDSLGHVKVIVAVEARLGRQLEPEQLVTIRSLADVAGALDGA